MVVVVVVKMHIPKKERKYPVVSLIIRLLWIKNIKKERKKVSSLYFSS
jgi:hypothetical protein